MHPPRFHVYLDTVARTGSIRKAAEKLHVASTALNRKILELEDEVGTPLFERLPRGVRLTAAGELLVAAVRRSMADLRSTVSQIEQLRGMVRGMVRIGCAESVASGLMPQRVAAFQALHPGVQFQLRSGVTGHILEALERDEIDLALVHDPVPSDTFKVWSAVAQPLCAMLRPDHPLASRSRLRLADCEPYPVALGDHSFGSRRLIDAWAAQSRLRLQVVLEASTVQSLKEFTRHTGAISFQFQIGTQREVAHGELVALPLSDALFGRSQITLGTRAGRSLPIAATSFLDSLMSWMAEHQHEQCTQNVCAPGERLR